MGGLLCEPLIEQPQYLTPDLMQGRLSREQTLGSDFASCLEIAAYY